MLGLHYNRSDVNKDMDFHRYSDADWSWDLDTLCSTSSYIFILNGAAIGWSSKLQSMVALSTTESKYIGLNLAGQHLAWLHTFFKEIGHPQRSPTKIRCDNQAAIILTKDLQFHAHTRHIDCKFHFVCNDLVATGKATVHYVCMHDQVADIFTKALSSDKHRKFARAMGLHLCSSGGVKSG